MVDFDINLKLNGGKYINSGAEGCVFYPELKCIDSKKPILKNAISKVFEGDYAFKVERNIAKKLHKIDPKNKFIVPYYGSCKTNIEVAKQTDEVNKCDLLNTYQSTYNQLLYKYAGVDLDKFKESKIPKKVKTIDDILKLFIPLFEGIVTLQEHKILHCDIKPGNILYDETTNRFYLTDFGLSIKNNQLKKETDMLEFTYLYYPPEFKVLALAREIEYNQTENTLYNNILKNYNSIGSDFLEFLKIKYGIDIPSEITEYSKKSINDGLYFTKLTKKLAYNKIDIYSLGMTIASLLYIMSSNSKLPIKNNTLFKEFIQQVLKLIIKQDPSHRIDCKEATLRMKNLFKIN